MVRFLDLILPEAEVALHLTVIVYDFASSQKKNALNRMVLFDFLFRGILGARVHGRRSGKAGEQGFEDFGGCDLNAVLVKDFELSILPLTHWSTYCPSGGRIRSAMRDSLKRCGHLDQVAWLSPSSTTPDRVLQYRRTVSRTW
jgi:hypothetical protein